MSINLIAKIKFWWLSAFGTTHRTFLTLVKSLAMVAIVALIFILPVIWQGVVVISAVSNIDHDSDVLIRHIQSGSWQDVSEDIQAIEDDVANIDRALGRLGPIVLIPVVDQTIDQIRSLTGPAVELFDVYREFSVLASEVSVDQSLDQTVMSIADPTKRQAFLIAIAQRTDRLQALNTRLDNIKKNFDAVEVDSFAGPLRDQLMEGYQLVDQAITATHLAMPLIGHLPDIMGYDRPRTYLLLFQNNTELRPTGGFIGSYGLITVSKGEITNLQTDDVYNLDRLTEGKVTELAPEPIRNNVQKYWYLRDANWSPDWPTSAENIKRLWDSEHRLAGLPARNIDGIITLTPDVVADVLGVIGSITIRGVTFDQNNFTEQLELFVEFDYSDHGIAEEERKAIMLPLALTMIARVSMADHNQLLSIWRGISASIAEKKVLFYSFDNKVQEIIGSQEWSGAVATVDHDYLMVIDSNLASLKTDPAMERAIDYRVSVDPVGTLKGQLTATYRHTLAPVKDLITRYRTYTRVYLPADTWIERAYIERGSQRQELVIGKDLIIADELGKRTVGVFFIIEPQTEAKLIIEYRLPERIYNQYRAGEYKLLVQKQPGTTDHNLTVDFAGDQPFEGYFGPQLPSALEQFKIRWQSDLTIDRLFRLLFNS